VQEDPYSLPLADLKSWGIKGIIPKTQITPYCLNASSQQRPGSILAKKTQKPTASNLRIAADYKLEEANTKIMMQ
jgi:hypothetical protein